MSRLCRLILSCRQPQKFLTRIPNTHPAPRRDAATPTIFGFAELSVGRPGQCAWLLRGHMHQMPYVCSLRRGSRSTGWAGWCALRSYRSVCMRVCARHSGYVALDQLFPSGTATAAHLNCRGRSSDTDASEEYALCTPSACPVQALCRSSRCPSHALCVPPACPVHALRMPSVGPPHAPHMPSARGEGAKLRSAIFCNLLQFSAIFPQSF